MKHALLLQQAAPAPGQPEGAGGGAAMISQFLPFILIFVVFWFLVIRPQRKQQKDREAMLGGLKKNDHVVTTGGILGIVDRIKDGEVILKVDEKSDIRLRVTRAAIVDIRKVAGTSDDEKEAKASEPAESK